MAWMMDEYGKLHGHTPAIVHRQADRARGLVRPRAGDRPRLRLHVPRGGPPVGLSPGRDRPSWSRASATSAPGRRGSCSSSARRWSASPMPPARSQRGGHRRRRPRPHIAEGGELTEFPGAEVISPDDLIALECDVLIPAALGGMIHEGNADRINCQDDHRGRQQPDHPRRRRDPDEQRRPRHPRRDGQRRRRRRLLLRVGPEHAAHPVVRARGQRQARRVHAQGLPRRQRPRQGGAPQPARRGLPGRDRASRRGERAPAATSSAASGRSAYSSSSKSKSFGGPFSNQRSSSSSASSRKSGDPASRSSLLAVVVLAGARPPRRRRLLVVLPESRSSS